MRGPGWISASTNSCSTASRQVESKLNLKGLSHEMDFGFWWHVWLVLGLNRERGSFLGIFLLLRWFYNANSAFLAVNVSLRWIDNVSGMYIFQDSWLLIGQQGLIYFFRYRPLLPIVCYCKTSSNPIHFYQWTRFNQETYTFCVRKSLLHLKILKSAASLT